MWLFHIIWLTFTLATAHIELRQRRQAFQDDYLSCYHGAGFYPHPKSCKFFYRCWEHQDKIFQKFVFVCPPGTIFNSKENNCRIMGPTEKCDLNQIQNTIDIGNNYNQSPDKYNSNINEIDNNVIDNNKNNDNTNNYNNNIPDNNAIDHQNNHDNSYNSNNNNDNHDNPNAINHQPYGEMSNKNPPTVPHKDVYNNHPEGFNNPIVFPHNIYNNNNNNNNNNMNDNDNVDDLKRNTFDNNNKRPYGNMNNKNPINHQNTYNYFPEISDNEIPTTLQSDKQWKPSTTESTTITPTTKPTMKTTTSIPKTTSRITTEMITLPPTTLKPVTTTEVKCDKVGFYRNPKNCSQFFQCFDHGFGHLSGLIFDCPDGLYFSETPPQQCVKPEMIPECQD